MDIIDKILMETRATIFTMIISYSCIVYPPFREAVSAQYFGEPEFMRTSLDNDWRLRNIQTSLLRGAKARRYSHHGGEVYNPARNSP